MSFLDNLESNLKSLEARDEAQGRRTAEDRTAERARALAIAPWADKLRNGAFTEELLRQATRLGHARRTKVRISWIGAVLRLEAGERRLELRPTPEGITAVFAERQVEQKAGPVDLEGSAEALAREWIG